MVNENNNQPEQVLWSGRISQWHFVGRWIAGVLAAAALTAALYFFGDSLSQSVPGSMPWAYALPLFVLFVTVVIVSLRRRERRYSITNRRVILETGLIAADSNEIRIQDIRSINVSKSGLSGLFGIGNVEFSSAATDDAEVVFFKIARADRVRDLVRKLQS